MAALFCGVIYPENICSSRERKNIAKDVLSLCLKTVQKNTHLALA
jgi:hypothetical protein